MFRGFFLNSNIAIFAILGIHAVSTNLRYVIRDIELQSQMDQAGQIRFIRVCCHHSGYSRKKVKVG